MIAFTILTPGPYLNANDREHWAPRARKVRTWRSAAAVEAYRYTLAGGLGRTRTWPMDVHFRFDVPDKRRRDPANYAPTCKALIDGMTDAGWWPDDTPEYVRTHEPELRVVGRKAALTVTITVKERT